MRRTHDLHVSEAYGPGRDDPGEVLILVGCRRCGHRLGWWTTRSGDPFRLMASVREAAMDGGSPDCDEALTSDVMSS